MKIAPRRGGMPAELDEATEHLENKNNPVKKVENLKFKTMENKRKLIFEGSKKGS
ncbi:MAG: hypothetical protein K6D59_07250 [Bacteroidales bacterium]|nr:hypothetical protein [Bacteroidales bacterium]